MYLKESGYLLITLFVALACTQSSPIENIQFSENNGGINKYRK